MEEITKELLNGLLPLDSVESFEIFATKIHNLFRIDAKYASNEASFPENFLLKLTNRKGNGRYNEEMLAKMEKAEYQFYEMKIELSTPVCLAAKPPYLVLSNVFQAGSLQDLSIGLNTMQLLNIARALGGFHAWSLKNTEKWMEMREKASKPLFIGFSAFAAGVCRKLAADYPDYFAESIKPIEDFAASLTYEELGLDVVEKLKVPAVLLHGNLGVHSILFSRERSLGGQEGVGNRVISFIEWQNCRCGVPGEDFAFLMFSSVSSASRRKEVDSLLRCYFRSLEEQLKRPPPYRMEQLKQSFRLSSPLAALNALLTYAEAIANEKSDRLKPLLERARDLCTDFKY